MVEADHFFSLIVASDRVSNLLALLRDRTKQAR